jgi:hypothetical protein
MEIYKLTDGVLNDNELLLADTGKVFHGGYIAIIKEYTYQNAWNNKETIKRFSKKDRLIAYINKQYPNFEIQL